MNSTKIDEYINSYSDCKLPKTISITLQGRRADLQVFRLPLNLTFYNLKNGRFAAEYADLVRKENRELDPTDPDDSKKIQDLLIGLDPKQSQILEKDLQQNGQKDPGIISHDGFVINGNRRRSVLERLASIGQSKFDFIEVARLPPNVSLKDLWKIEAGIQLSRNVQLDYGPINELLKFKEGIDAGLSPIEIAESLYGGFREKDIEDKLVEFKLISGYLIFIGEQGVFNKAKRIHEHFIDLRKILVEFEKTDSEPEDLVNAKYIGFQLIHDGVPAREFRKMKEILANRATREELWEARRYSHPGPSRTKIDKRRDAEERDEYTKARTVFNNCVDSIKALSEAEQPEKLINRALKNLRAIDVERANLSKPEIIFMLDEVDKVLRDLQVYR